MATKPPTKYQPFTKLLPFDKVFNPALVDSLAQAQVMPEINRNFNKERANQMRGFAQSGSFRSGYAPAQAQSLADQFSRQGKEQVGQFSDQVKNWTNDWYTKQMEAYGKNPSKYVMPSLPSWDDYMKSNPSLASLYSQITGTGTALGGSTPLTAGTYTNTSGLPTGNAGRALTIKPTY